ncbi:hypothetical protein HYFRA_00004292 [Hymenoscyphus fraxineus]|uniref:Nephrocystin 3-like N-terminal domain-containing protein n=1 Tax=Hymenoscyphus fraxineus TaxID=746836 RepID=A0A9N9KLL0_9HELO|nr:hypothetical protein HYFRA_00004292 [Hymenoscyphus fraxineus]
MEDTATSPSTTGLSVIVNPESPNIDIVFVHGFTGHPERTWTHKGEVQSQYDQVGHEDDGERPSKFRKLLSGKGARKSVYWPRDLLPTTVNNTARVMTFGYDTNGEVQSQYDQVGHEDDGERPSKFRKLLSGKGARKSVYWPRDLLPTTVNNTARVMTFGYDTNVRHKFGNPINQQTVYDIAYDFLIALEVERRTQPSRPLVFIVHSLGGIVVKETLRRSRGFEFTQIHLRNIYESTSGILFFGTPHSGADPRGPLQHIAERVIKVAGFSVSRQIVDTLLPSSERLKELRDEFGPMAHRRSWIIYSFQEQYGVPALGGNKVVEDTASCLNDSTCETTQHIASNHMEMCRFNGLEDVEYKKVAGALNRVLAMTPIKQVPTGLKVPLNAENRQFYLDSLAFNQIDARHATIKSAHAKTCRWFLKTHQYQDWLDASKIPDHHGFLWIKGKPATGKSTIMKFTHSVVKKTRETAGTVIISFFFNARGDDLEKSTIGMYRALLFQLLEEIPELQHVFELAGLRPQNPDGAFHWDIETVKHLLGRAIECIGKRTLFCFIDALDECDDDQVLDMVESFESIGEVAIASQTRLHVCFSSRHYPHITIEKGIQLILEGEEGHQQDITNYINSELKAGRSKQIEQIKGEIFERASSIFLWVVLVVKILNSEFRSGRIHALRRRLDEIPDGLDELFSDILTRDGHNIEELILCLQWILFAKRPLKREELYYAILSTPDGAMGPWDPDEICLEDMERFILSSSKGLAGVTKSKNKTVQFIHESVRDYLLRGKGFETLRAGLKNIPGQSHDALKDCCLMYLEFDKSDYIPEPLPLASTEEAASLRQTVYQKFPFLHYATENIFYHADCSHGNGVEQLGFLGDLLAIGESDMHLPNTHCSTPVLAVPGLKYHIKDWILTRNLLEKYQIRRYTPDASLLYIFAERDLSNLLRLELARVPHMDIKGERYGFPVHAAIANSCDLALRAFLATGSSLFTESEHEEAVQCVRENRREITSQSTETLLSWALENRKLPLIKILHRSEKVDNSSIKTSMKDFLLNAAYHGKSDWVKLVSSADQFASDPLLFQSALCNAAGQGHEEVARLIIQYGEAFLDPADEYVKERRGPLWHAASSGHTGIMRLLLDYEIDSGILWEVTLPLLEAATKGHVEIVKILLQTGRCDINCSDRGGDTPLYLAVFYGHTEIVKMLLEIDECDVNKKNLSSDIPLSQAISKGYLEIFKLLMATGRCDINCSDTVGNTPLYLAVISGHTEMVKMLLENDECDINKKHLSSNTPLSQAISKGYLEIFKLLMATGRCDITGRAGYDPLSLAIRGRYANVVKLLLDTDTCYVNKKDPTGDTPLSLAAISNQVDVARLLLQTPGCDVNSRNDTGDTPLSLAARVGAVEVLRVLLETGQCIVDSKNNKNKTPLLLAIRLRSPASVDILKMLLATDKCDFNSMDSNGNTPLLIAVTYCMTENEKIKEGWSCAIVRLLLETGKCNINWTNNNGDTALLVAVKRCNSEAVQILLGTGRCDLNLIDPNGDTPLLVAARLCAMGSQYSMAGQYAMEIAGMILKSGGADLARTNILGQTPREVAMIYGIEWLVELIDEYLGGGMVIDGDERLSEPEQP